MPSVLLSAFSTAIYASKAAHPGAMIYSGDLMVCKVVPTSQLKVNDAILIRGGNSWRLAILALNLTVYLRWTRRPRLERHFPA